MDQETSRVCPGWGVFVHGGAGGGEHTCGHCGRKVKLTRGQKVPKHFRPEALKGAKPAPPPEAATPTAASVAADLSGPEGQAMLAFARAFNGQEAAEPPPAPMSDPAICSPLPLGEGIVCSYYALRLAPGEPHGPVAPCPWCGHAWDREGEPPLFAVEITGPDSYYDHVAGHGRRHCNPVSDDRAARLAVEAHASGKMPCPPAQALKMEPWLKLCVPRTDDTCEREPDTMYMRLPAPDCEEWPFLLANWHHSQWDPVYALGASGWNEHVKRSHGRDALYNLRLDARKSDDRPRGDGRKLDDEAREELQACIDGLAAWMARTEPHPTACTSAHCRPGRGLVGWLEDDGSRVLDASPIFGRPPTRIVLRSRRGGGFVTHVQTGDTYYWGHYYSSLEEAVMDFRGRAEEAYAARGLTPHWA